MLSQQSVTSLTYSDFYERIAEFMLLDMNRNINWDLLGIEVNCPVYEDIS